MDSNATRKPAAKEIFDEFIMPDLLARDHVSLNTVFVLFDPQLSGAGEFEQNKVYV